MNRPFHRLDYTQHQPEVYQALLTASQLIHQGPLPPSLTELLSLRVSQLNGCAFCLDMHASALRASGVEPRKLDTLAGWRDSRFFGPGERAALAWADALTALPLTTSSAPQYQALGEHFDPSRITALTLVIALINAWNRLGVGLQPTLP